MLLATSKCGATLHLDALPRPPDTSLLRWLLAFPSYGYLFSVRPGAADEIITRSTFQGLTAAVVGTVDDSRMLHVARHGSSVLLAPISA